MATHQSNKSIYLLSLHYSILDRIRPYDNNEGTLHCVNRKEKWKKLNIKENYSFLFYEGAAFKNWLSIFSPKA